MVKGLARFRDHFREERGQYVLIGGVAAMHWLERAGAPRMTPIPGGEDISSLSAILMDDAYYGIVRENVQEEDGLPMLKPEGLILLKARAWVDLTERKAQGGAVDERDVRKHRTDVFRLCQLLTPASPVSVPENVRMDLLRFLDHFSMDSPEWPGILQALAGGGGGPVLSPEDMLRVLENAFVVQ